MTGDDVGDPSHMNTGEVINQLLQCIAELNAEEAAYWCRVLLNRAGRDGAELKSLPIDQLVAGFGLGEEELSGLLAEVIMIVVKDEDFPVLLERFGAALEEGLNAESLPILQTLCLEIVMNIGLASEHDVPESLKVASLKCLFSENASLSAKVIELLKHVKPDFIENLLLSMPRPEDPVAQFRFMEALLAVGQGGESQKLLQSFLNELKSLLSESSDPLLLANALHTIADCVQGREAFLIMQQNGIIERLDALLSAPNTGMVSRIIDFFGQCALNDCLSAEEAAYLAQKLKHLLESEDANVKSSVTFTVCAFAAKDSLFPTVSLLMPEVFSGLVHGHTSIQLAALHGLGVIFKQESLSEAKASLLHQLNSFLSESIFSWLHKRALSNFDEQKSAAYFCIQGMLSSIEGLQAAVNTSSIMADLLNREFDDSMLGSKWKYGILEMIAKKRQLFVLLNEPLQRQVMRYLGQGVVFKAVSTRVAFEPVQ